jgi:Zn-dependent M28 family amino/carboxypeptidase
MRTNTVYAFATIAFLIVIGAIFFLMRRNRSHRGPLPPLSDSQRALAGELEGDVRALCANGPRNVWASDAMAAAARHIESALSVAGYRVERQTFVADGIAVDNLIAEIPGTSKEIVVIGAHYDSVDGSPGADDNASGVAGALAIAKRLAGMRPTRTLRFVFFANEEPPHFQTESMGSWQYAKRCHDRGESIAAMLSLEMLGYYNDARGSQQYPPAIAALYPDSGDFIGFAANLRSRKLVRRCVSSFRRHSRFPAESASLPEVIPQIGWSDQWAFWHFGWPALMVTDTALFRNPHYHQPSDTPTTLDYESMARVVEGLVGMVGDLGRP